MGTLLVRKGGLSAEKQSSPKPASSFSERTIEEEDIRFMQFANIYPLNKYYTVYYFTSIAITVFTLSEFSEHTYLAAVCMSICLLYSPQAVPCMIIGSYLEGEMNYTFETAHVLLIAFNMLTQNITNRYHHNIVDTLFRAIDNKFFSYGDTMDENTQKIIDELHIKKRERKKLYGKIYKIQVTSAALGLIAKNLLLELINGPKENDGENWLIYQAPIAVYVPFSNYWVPYVIGMMLSYNSVVTIALTSMSTTTSFIRFCEELLQQLQIIKLGLKNAVARANHLYKLKFGRSYTSEVGETNKDFDSCLNTCLTKSVEHHIVIIKLFEDFKDMMYIPLFTVIFDGGALICMSTVLLLTSESLAMKLSMPSFIATEMFYTFVYCYYGEQLTTLFHDIGEEIYQDDWTMHDKIVKPYMIIIRAFTFFPKKLSAAGFTSPNLENFGNVLRTTYSLMNFLAAQG